jgi:hypothetical protein
MAALNTNPYFFFKLYIDFQSKAFADILIEWKSFQQTSLAPESSFSDVF